MEDRRRFNDIMDELNRMMEEVERNIEESIRTTFQLGKGGLSKPRLYGFSMNLDPTGQPYIRTFGDMEPSQGYRGPVTDQVIEKSRGELRVIVELPGVEKEDIQLQALEDSITITAEHGERMYKTQISLKAEVNPSKATASYRNGVLEVVFQLKDNTNKGFKKINIE